MITQAQKAKAWDKVEARVNELLTFPGNRTQVEQFKKILEEAKK